MSAFKRVISTKLYELERKRMRKKSQQRGQLVIPKIITFSIGNTKDARNKQGASRGHVRRSKKTDGINVKKVIGLGLIVVGCLLLLGKCFGGGQEEPKKDGKKIETTQSYGSYVQDFAIGEKDLNKWLNYSQKHKLSYAHTLGVWAYESYKGTSSYRMRKLMKQSSERLENNQYYSSAEAVYEQFIYDIEVFPVKNSKDYTYENTWKDPRTYQSKRQHLGVDLMSASNRTGEIDIRSITSGTVEKIGWNELGGYRVGIRSEGGAYFYYAHLDENPSFLKEGDTVVAGQVIGKMGNTGYGEEGTRGKFPVHLHLGIAVQTKENKEYWINPYSVLKYLEKYKS